jgi:glutaredoxin 3
MTRVEGRKFAAATVIGASPRGFAYAAVGGTLGDYSSPQELAAIGVLVAVTIGGGALLWRIRRTRTLMRILCRSEGSKSEMIQADASAEITVYTLPWCPRCARARAILTRRGLPFREVDGSGVPDFRQRIAAVTGCFTVPQVVIDGDAIGGADQLAALDRLGVLTTIAAGERFPITREVRRISPRSVFRWVTARLRGRRDVSPARRVRVKLDRAGRVLATNEADVQVAKEEHDGEGMCRTAG